MMKINKTLIIKQEEQIESINSPTGEENGGEGSHTYEWREVDVNETLSLSNMHRIKIRIADSVLAIAKDFYEAKLVLTATEDINSPDLASLYAIDKNKLIIDVTEYLLGDKKQEEIELNSLSEGFISFYSHRHTAYFPYMILKSQKEDAEIKTLPLVDKATACVDLKTREATIDVEIISPQSSVHGVGVSYVNGKDGLKLSLEETFDGEVWTDAKGKSQAVSQKFYYKKDGVKYYVAESDVTVNQGGSFSCEVEGSLYDVTREEAFLDGTKASTEIKGVKNLELIETRSDELKQVQEQIKSYEDTVSDLTLWKWDSSEEKIICSQDKIDLSNKESLKAIQESVKNGWNLSTKGEKVQLDQLYAQKQNVESIYFEPSGVDYLYLLRTRPTGDYSSNHSYYQELQLRHAIADYNEAINYYRDNYSNFPIGKIVDSTTLTKLNINSYSLADSNVYWHYNYQAPTASNPNPSNNFSPYFITGRDIKRMLYSRNALIVQLDRLIDERNAQRSVTSTQISYIKGLGEKYLSQLENIFKEYGALKEKESEILKNTPVSFIINGDTYKGFNKDGELIIFFKTDKIYASVNRDKNGKIISITDENQNAIIFKYNDDGLASITDVRGRNYFIEAGEYLTTVTYPDGDKAVITLERIANANKIAGIEKGGIKASLTYSENGAFSEVSRISNEAQIDFAQISATDQEITVTNYDKSLEKYTLLDGEIEKRYTLKADIVIDAVMQKTEITNATEAKKRVIVNSPTRASLYQEASVVDFSGDSIAEEYDFDGNNIKTVENSEDVTVTTSRTFDEYNQCLTETCVTVNKNTQEEFILKVEHSYSPTKQRVKTVSYVVGEELTNGKTVEELVYNKEGLLKQSFKYNTLDSSTKFYTEHLYNELGEHIADLDQTGEGKTEIKYVDKTSYIQAQKAENGTTFAYGYDLADRVTSISQSTKAGESSSIQRVYDEKGLLIKLISGNTVIEYTYDDKRRIKSIKLNGESNRTFTYQNEGKRVMDYHAIGLAITTEKDDLGNVISVTRGSAEVERYTYNKGLVKEATKNGMLLRYTYDSKKRVTQIGTLGDLSRYSYDLDGNLSEHVRRGETTTYEYSTDSKKSLKKVTKGDLTTSLKTDLYGRNTGKEITNSSNAKIYGEEISYLKKGDHATNIPNVIKYYDAQLGGYGQELKYSYDANGNICQITEEGKLLAKYTYDGLNRLIREDNARLGKTYLLEYDSAGNVISKRVCAFTLDNADKITVFETEDVFTYNGDLLMSRNAQKCAYTRGRPTKYLDQTVSYKQLGLIKSYNGVTYQYDNSGNRISKGDITFTNDRDGKAISQSNGISFIFDHNEEIIGIKNGDVPYYFRKNLQGDVICLLDNAGNVVVRYYYDAWGNHKIFDASGAEITDTTHIGHLNPIRYRSYYYDSELGFYYLKTRYYDPSVGRFITPDYVDYVDLDVVNGLNLYAYCNNNPVMAIDPNGNDWWNPFSWDWMTIGSVIGGSLLAVIGTAMTIASIPISFITGGGFITQIGFSTAMYGELTVASVFNNTIKQDMDNIKWNPFNANAYISATCQMVSFYKGMPVVWVNHSSGRSGSFLGIWLSGVNVSDDIKHEWGHGIQQGILGALKYGICIGLPSWREWSLYKYYDRPWEITADLFGGVSRNEHKRISRGWNYLLTSSVLGLISYLFLLGEYKLI